MEKNSDKIFVGIQTRLNSTRFPRKAFAKILGVPLIVRVVQRIQLLPYDVAVLCPIDEVKAFQDILSEYSINIPIFGGDENDVLARYYLATKHFGEYDFVVRVTGDNPLISVPLAQMLIDGYQYADLSHYLQNPLGTGVEMIKSSALEKSYLEATTSFQKEHVTQYIYQNPELFTIAEPVSPFILSEYSHLSVDNIEDMALIIRLLEEDPEWDISRFF